MSLKNLFIFLRNAGTACGVGLGVGEGLGEALLDFTEPADLVNWLQENQAS